MACVREGLPRMTVRTLDLARWRLTIRVLPCRVLCVDYGRQTVQGKKAADRFGWTIQRVGATHRMGAAWTVVARWTVDGSLLGCYTRHSRIHSDRIPFVGHYPLA